ncbi:MAG: glycosyltransferase family 2 protein [Luteibacter sp.]|uniref:glycosyltransferase family 2 protein n=1 Tax=Luteibacter sp. TaxID=1886636 RepID=UPI002808B279|nr:glycosyltransferase family 2 protein [Luteibacter sp.]MDQ7996443.1 glycosyltransferase family 2 protein [Luteibacter sp.]MDQ8047929.1 glycosyltransferase family 2 protein [Luteibacter sp.]
MTLPPAATGASLRTSVVLCTYNGSAYLREQLDSLLAQSCLPDQIVVVDDASSDGTQGAIGGFEARCRKRGIDIAVKLRSENVGFVANFADALRLAKGDIVFLCDQDDVWSPGKLDTMSGRFQRDPDLSLLFTDARLVDAEGAPLGTRLFEALELAPADWDGLAAGNAFPVLLKRAVVTGATAAFRWSLIDKALPVAPGWVHDEWLATVASLFGRVAPLNDALIDYRQHGGNQIGMRRRTVAMRVNDLFRPRNELLRVAIDRMIGLKRRFGDDRDAPLAYRRLLAERLAHYEQRIRIGDCPRLLRWPLVISEWRAGRYVEHSNGMSSVLRDLLRKH